VHRFLVLLVCAAGLSPIAARAQSSDIAPIRIPSGTILSFYVQTRLKAAAGDALDALPKGTVLRVKMLDAIDSAVNHDGTPFHGVLASSIASGDQVVVHADAEVRGLLALLRSASHPEGFRYELLVTGLVDHGEAYTLTAFLGSALPGDGSKPPSNSMAGINEPAVAKRPSQSDSPEIAHN
jgi:hypothetical protein